MNRLFFLLAVPSFSLLLSAAPLLEEIILGTRETGLLPFLWFLSVTWGANTLASPAHFLLLGRRRLRPLLWSNVIMTVGAIAFGMLGGWLLGVNGALAGVAVSFIASAAYLQRFAQPDHGHADGIWTTILRQPLVLLPAAATLVVAAGLQATDVSLGDTDVRLTYYALGMTATLLMCVFFSRLRDITLLAGRIRF